MVIGVTTAIKPSERALLRAEQVRHDLEGLYIPRRKDSLNKLIRRHGLTHLFVVEQERLLLKTLEDEIFWHPGTAVKKLWSLEQGKKLKLLEAIQAAPSDTILDCTLGFGSDALVMASCLEDGHITGLEASPLLAYLTRRGLEEAKDLQSLSKKISVYQQNHVDYLSLQADNSFDIIYFDPMFQHPKDSPGLSGLRSLASHGLLTKETIDHALRVARKRVVVKERVGSGVFKSLGITDWVGDYRFGSIVYGQLEKKPTQD